MTNPETNRTVIDRIRRKDRYGDQGCAYCRPNRSENKHREGKHGADKPRYKDKR